MRILMLAPEPFQEEHGTLIAVDLLIKAICEAGHQVDLLTFHLGEDRMQDGLKIHRIRPWPRLKRIQPGLSVGKIRCDLFMSFAVFRLSRRNKYDLIHAVEESAFMAMVARPMTRIPYVYDMDSSMADQIVDRYRWARQFKRLMH